MPELAWVSIIYNTSAKTHASLTNHLVNVSIHFYIRIEDCYLLQDRRALKPAGFKLRTIITIVQSAYHKPREPRLLLSYLICHGL